MGNMAPNGISTISDIASCVLQESSWSATHMVLRLRFGVSSAHSDNTCSTLAALVTRTNGAGSVNLAGMITVAMGQDQHMDMVGSDVKIALKENTSQHSRRHPVCTALQAKPTHFILKKQLQHTRDLRLAPTAQPACLIISPTKDSRQVSYRGHSTVRSVTRAGSSRIPELNDCRMAIGPRTFMVQINAQIVLLASGQAASKD
jgi:hypothetical protein